MKILENTLSAFVALLLFAALLLYSQVARDSAIYGLDVCTSLIIPSLFPFFIVSSLLTSLGLIAKLAKFCAPIMTRLFHVSGAGAAVFVISVCGGYPLGAKTLADLHARREVSSEECSHLLLFCNNSGPAFIVGAVGIGVFSDSYIGLALYVAHILAALTTAFTLRFSAPKTTTHTLSSVLVTSPVPFPKAITSAVSTSISSLINVCGFVIAFSVLVGLLDAIGIFSFLAAELAMHSVLGPSLSRVFLTGFLELGSAIAAMHSLPADTLSLCVAAFVIGLGGISVHFQTLSVLADTDIKSARHMVGRLLSALFSVFYILLFSIFTA